jgi:hypothetical protein
MRAASVSSGGFPNQKSRIVFIFFTEHTLQAI